MRESSCRRRWRQTYVMGKEEPETEAQRLGREVHAQLEGAKSPPRSAKRGVGRG